MFCRFSAITGLCLVALVIIRPAPALACTGPAGVPGEIIYNATTNIFQGCTDKGWTSFHKPNNAPAAACTQPAATPGEIVYKSAYGAFMGCTTVGWQAFHSFEDPCLAASPATGTGCKDGTIYIGRSPAGNLKMYATGNSGSGQQWNAGNSSDYVDVAGLANCTTGAQASCNTGSLNTPILAAADSSSAGGFQPHNAASYCQNLVAHGYSDWYLPAYHELAMMYNARNSGAFAGTFPTADSFPTSLYWSSSEFSGVGAMPINFATGGGYPFNASSNVDKRWPFIARCVRTDVPDPLTVGLIGHWKFDEGSGATAADSSGSGNTGTLTNMNTATAWVTGKNGTALEFDGVNDVVNAGSSSMLDNLAAASGCAWTRRTVIGNATFPAIFDKSNNDGFSGWNFYLNKHYVVNEGKTYPYLGYYSGRADYKEQDSNIPFNGTWQHVCFTWDGTDNVTGMKLYHNGALISSAAATGADGTTLNDAAFSLGIGGQVAGTSADQSYTGRLDDIRLYNRALSDAEIMQVYSADGGT